MDSGTCDSESGDGWVMRAADKARCDDTVSPQMAPLECSAPSAVFIVSDVIASSIGFIIIRRSKCGFP
jgi:hypothetical protein